MAEQTAEMSALPGVDASLSDLKLDVRHYLAALHEAAGMPLPEISEEQLQAALRQVLPESAPTHTTEAKGLLTWLGGLPGQAFANIHAIWAEWLQRTSEIDRVWPMRLFHATHDMVGEQLQHLGGEVRRVAGEKLTALEGRYGRTGAILVLTAAVVLTPVPVPGTTLAPVLVAEGIRAVGIAFWGTSTPATAMRPGVHRSNRAGTMVRRSETVRKTPPPTPSPKRRGGARSRKCLRSGGFLRLAPPLRFGEGVGGRGAFSAVQNPLHRSQARNTCS